MCEKPRAKYQPDPGRPPMPLDEGLFRFITDILIPVMDVYDDDPIRKDAVQSQNLIVIQEKRPSIRSMYSFLAQPWPFCDNEKVVVPSTLKFVYAFALEKLTAEAEGGAPAAAAGGDGDKKEGEGEPKGSGVDFAAALGGDERLSDEQLAVVLEVFDQAIAKVTEFHPEAPEQRALLFWEFFETLMHISRELASNSSTNTPLHQGLPALVQTGLAVMALVADGEAALPEPDLEGLDDVADEMEGEG